MAVSAKKLYPKYVSKMDSLNKDKDIKEIYFSLLNGKNSYLRLSRKGSSSFDPSWIDTIEDCLYDLGEIINNPREVTKIDSNVTPIELAKKVDSESVQHLASHTQFIKEVDEKGEVIPSKILSHSHIEDIHTYENRFIATFIRQLLLFIEKRYEFIKNQLDLTKDEVMLIKNSSKINGQEVEIETKIKIKKDDNDKAAVDARDYIERIMKIREYVSYYYNSPFMKALKTERNVRRPILQTNIIRKNPKYHKCYETYLFIERFDSLGVSYEVDENYQVFNEEERQEMTYLLLGQYLAIQDEEEYKSFKRNGRIYKPKILTSLDDEKFIYGDLVKGPIEFVRVDENYRNYLESKAKNDNVPLHPNKYEREYYSKELEEKRNAKLELREIEKLINRIEREIFAYEKDVLAFIERREYEEAEERRKEIEALRKYQFELIEERRRRIIEAAKLDQQNIDYVSLEEISSLGPILLFKKGKIDDISSIIEEIEEVKEEDNVDLEASNYDEMINSSPEEEKPLEEPQKEERTPIEEMEVKEEVVYHVVGESQITYVNGHKEETFIVQEVDNVKQDSEPVKKVEAKKQTGPVDILKNIPGEYILRTIGGYYVEDGKFTKNKDEACIFHDFTKANLKKKIYGGKVIKL